MEVIAVFDAYRVAGHQTECSDYHNIHVVFTKKQETADQYIEKFAHMNASKYQVTVATSDGLEQIIIRGRLPVAVCAGFTQRWNCPASGCGRVIWNRRVRRIV